MHTYRHVAQSPLSSEHVLCEMLHSTAHLLQQLRDTSRNGPSVKRSIHVVTLQTMCQHRGDEQVGNATASHHNHQLICMRACARARVCLFVCVYVLVELGGGGGKTYAGKDNHFLRWLEQVRENNHASNRVTRTALLFLE